MTALAVHVASEHEMFPDICRRFFENEIMSIHLKSEEEGVVPGGLWRKAGEPQAERMKQYLETVSVYD